MSIKTYLKAAAVALPLALGSTKAAAQSTEGIVKNAQKVITTDTLKTMDQKAADARAYVIKKYSGHYSGSVKNGKIDNGTLEYSEKGKSVPAASASNPETSIYIEGSYVSGSKLPSAGYRVAGGVEKGENAFDVAGVFSKGDGKTDVIGDVAYTRSFPLTEELDATGKIGVEGVMHKINGGDSYGSLYPQIKAGLKYNHKFDNDAFINVKGEVGGAAAVNFKSETLKTAESGKFVANAELEAGYKNVSAFVNGGKDAAMGNNIGGGARVKF